MSRCGDVVVTVRAERALMITLSGCVWFTLTVSAGAVSAGIVRAVPWVLSRFRGRLPRASAGRLVLWLPRGLPPGALIVEPGTGSVQGASRPCGTALAGRPGPCPCPVQRGACRVDARDWLAAREVARAAGREPATDPPADRATVTADDADRV